MPGLTRRSMLGAGAALTGGTAIRALGAVAPPTLTVQAMQADIRLLRQAYGRLHPGLLRYNTQAQVDARFDQLADAARRPLTLGGFYVALSRCLATIRCGHSYANFYNQSKAVRAALFDAPTRLPLQFVWLGDRMIVTADPFATGIAPGSEILAIDGRPARTILSALMQVARADGHNDAKRRQLMSVLGEDGYESFDVFYALIFGGRTRYALQIAAPDGRRRAALVDAVTLEKRRSQQAIADAGRDDGPIWTMARRGRAGVLTMNGWGLYNSKWNWRGWLDAEVDRLVADRVPALIVDIRRNEGGEDCGDALVARLTDRPIVSDPARRLVRYQTLPADLRPYCDTWDRAFDTLGVGAARYDDRFYELAGEERGATVIAPKGPRYTGKIVVLTGPQNSSATFAFAQMIQRERLGTLVGEPTGGNRRGINGGCFYFFRLPETGLEADLPLIGTFPRTAEPDAGIVPDIIAARSPQATASGTDVAMDRALAMLG
ncbi:S41 family peptidase [Sphingomonas donggukensis]|uniref:S41 family peptidase n=1 Tax=Sphingomonas donggukensis TaxID=2949093 RepID=A0ABY4TV32_9SPHN|nr:S41 family peptidase [Sphingomonas donggukensis]URW76253.1 S41 family peptidase [Sphingomonas donggukensis]